MAWVQSEQAVGEHPKTLRLSELLFTEALIPTDVANLATIGLVHRLWWWALDYAPDGVLGRFTDAQIARGCRWGGDPALLVASLTEAGFLNDDKTVHDWGDYIAGDGDECRDSAANLPQTCRDSAANLPQTCRGDAAILPQTCRKPAAEKASRVIDGEREEELEKEKDTKEKEMTPTTGDTLFGPAPAPQVAAVTTEETLFGEFWTAYPRRLNKTAARRAFHNLTRVDRLAAVRAAKHYGAYVRATRADLQFVPHPATFIGRNRGFEDWVDGPPPGCITPRVGMTCRCGTDMTYDETGRAHCPICGGTA